MPEVPEDLEQAQEQARERARERAREHARERARDQTRKYFIYVIGVDPEDPDAVHVFRERLAFLEMREKRLIDARKKRAVFLVAIASAMFAAIVPGAIQWLMSSISFHRAGN